MKTIILLITLSTCVAIGQEWGEAYTKSIPFTPLTLEDWDEYVKECWNDSTAILDIWYPANSEGWKNDSLYISQIEIDTIWIHKTKSTFEGFIEWLKRKK